MSRRGHLVSALSQADFRRLLAVRLVGQFGDGVFQASLAGAVLFAPERQAHASDVAAGFAVVLIPYSVIGPFAGVLLDRWRRQRVLIVANLMRAAAVLAVVAEIAGGLRGVPFYASALVVVSLSRFVLSALSAGLPHVVETEHLVTANALSTTVGAIVTTIGGAGAVGVRALLGDTDGDYAVISLAAVFVYVVAAWPARGFDPDQLGPDEVERSRRETVADVARGLVDGAHHVIHRRAAFAALLAIGVHRLSYGVTTVCTILLYRNYFSDDGVLRDGITGLAQLVAAVALGGALAAVVTPAATRRFGYVAWPAAMLAGAGVTQLALGLPFTLPATIAAGALLGFVAQGVKICVDTIVQVDIEDDFRGRVFAFYDALFNVTLVLAAVLTAVVLPEDGHSPTAVVVISVAYVATALGYVRWAPAELVTRTAVVRTSP
ncbi:MAG TPA: MFS transporter [Jatrophihabitantaceae bacterium]|nr:MFS transporter [Jatrophihabitantaceae bacterium]